MGQDPIDDKSWFKWWFGAVRQQAINLAYVDPDLCHLMALLSHSVLIYWGWNKMADILQTAFSNAYTWIL